MAHKVAEHMDLRPVGVKRTNTKIVWAPFANGDTWCLLRGEDWHCKTSTQVVEMATRYANSNNLDLYFERDDNRVWVRFTRKAGHPVPEHAVH